MLPSMSAYVTPPVAGQTTFPTQVAIPKPAGLPSPLQPESRRELEKLYHLISTLGAIMSLLPSKHWSRSVYKDVKKG